MISLRLRIVQVQDPHNCCATFRSATAEYSTWNCSFASSWETATVERDSSFPMADVMQSLISVTFWSARASLSWLIFASALATCRSSSAILASKQSFSFAVFFERIVARDSLNFSLGIAWESGSAGAFFPFLRRCFREAGSA